MTSREWRNWAGNQQFEHAALKRPTTLAELASNLRQAGPVRVAGSGHSFTPLVQTPGTVFDLSEMTGPGITVDTAARTARIPGWMRLSEIGPVLWQHGLAIANQGDVDVQTLAGALATGTKGSGVEHGTMSSRITALTLLNAQGEQIEIDATTPERLHAAQVSLGALGVVTEVELSLVPTYHLREENAVLSVAELQQNWEQLKAGYHHFSFWWMPTATSSEIYGLPPVPADHAYVKMLTAVPVDHLDPATAQVIGETGKRTGPAHVLYPDTEIGDPFYELEYVVAAAQDLDCFLAVRDAMQNRFPSETSPVQVRWQKADEAFLSPQYRRDSVSISVSGMENTDYEPFLRGVDEMLRPWDARPHWGKIHYLDGERVKQLYPALDDFRKVRAELDPDGVFLNDHLRELLG